MKLETPKTPSSRLDGCRIIDLPDILDARGNLTVGEFDKHIPFVAFFILFWLWLLLAYVKQIL